MTNGAVAAGVAGSAKKSAFFGRFLVDFCLNFGIILTLYSGSAEVWLKKYLHLKALFQKPLILKSIILKSLILKAVHKYICIYLYTSCRHPSTTRKLQNPR